MKKSDIKERNLSYIENRDCDVHLSRYKVLRKIIDNDGSGSYLETQNQTKIPESANDFYHSVTVSEENRLDILANNYYGDPTLWWAIAMANNIIDPFTVPRGTRLRIPPSSTLNFPSNKILNR